MKVPMLVRRGDVDMEVTCEVVYHKGIRGTRDSYGVPQEPDDEPEWEVIDAIDLYGNSVWLSYAEEKHATELAATSWEPHYNEDDWREER